MKQEHRMLLAIAASIGIFYVWSTWFAPPPPTQAPAPETVASATTSSTSSARAAPDRDSETADRGTPDGIPDPQADIPEKIITLRNNQVAVTLTNHGGVPTSWQMLEYQRDVDGKEVHIEAIESPIAAPLRFTLEGLGQLLPERPHYEIRQQSDRSATFVWQADEIRITKKITLEENTYAARVAVTVENRSSAILQGRFALGWDVENFEEATSGFFAMFQRPSNRWHPLYYIDGGVTRLETTDSIVEDGQREGALFWGGVENRYFLAAILPGEGSAQTRFAAERTTGEGEGLERLQTTIATAPMAVPAGGQATQEFRVYMGPKEISQLKVVGANLDESLNYGFFSVIALPILYLLKFFYTAVSNYGLAIIFMTILIKALLHPITKTSLKSMRRMQLIQPQLKEIREKFKEDKQRLNQEMMSLFKTHKVNPMGGCLPMVLQIPVYIALYQVLWNSIELYRAPFFWFYTDLSAPDPYYITPILLGVAFFLQQKFTPSPTMDPAQKKMMMFMPLMFSVFMFFLPSGLVIYILVNTTYSVLQQWLMNRGLGFRDLFRGNLTAKSA